MSPEFKTAAAGEAGCGLRGASSAHAPRTTQQALRTPHSQGAFTLIEIMIVVAIMGIVMTMSVPIVYKVWHRAPMVQAVHDVQEVFKSARDLAIMQGKTMEVVLHPKENRLEVSGFAAPAPGPGGEGAVAVGNARPTHSSGLAAQLSRDIIIETLDINMSGVEYNDAETATVRFYPNGVADEMRMILFDGKDRMGIEVETTTGLADAVPNPLREWTRR
jgi:prepilin-type N-terminal cleavage/methylation domain-containing protein